MTLGPVMIDVAGLELSATERDMLKHPLVGGIIFFTRNYESPEQLMRLVESIQKVRSPHILIGVDHEGGRVQRFRNGFTHIPAAGRIGQSYLSDHKAGTKLAETCGWLMSIELRAVGIDFSFAPVLDVDRGISEVIGDRSYGKDPEVVATLAQAFARGMHKAGMVAVGKHFPGHGAVQADSHVACPVDKRRFEDIYAEDILPFERMIRNGLAGIMPAHVVYSEVDPKPAGFSSFWIKEVLRNRLEFQGVVFSDDLSMEGASLAGNVVDRAHAAIKAGCDMVLVCNDPGSAEKVLDELQYEDDPASQLRLARMRGRHFVNRRQLLKEDEWKLAVAKIDDFIAGDSLQLDV